MADSTDLDWAKWIDEEQDRVEELSDALQELAMAALESHRVPINRIKDEDYIYDELGSQLGSAVNKALRVLRGESA